MPEIDAVLAEALEDIKAGRARAVPDYLQLVRRTERAELEELLSIFYMHEAIAAGPEPVDPSRFERALGVIDRLSASGRAGALPAALVELRRARRLRRDDVVAALAERFGVKGAGGERLRRAYHELETGQLSGRGLSRRLLGALGEIFHVDVEDLAAAATRAPAGSSRSAQVFGRGVGETRSRGDVASARERRPGRGPEERLVDELFYEANDG